MNIDSNIRKQVFSTIKNDDPYSLLEILNKIQLKPINYPFIGGETLLHKAAMYNSIRCIGNLIEEGLDVNIVDESNNTPLMTALGQGNFRATSLLIEKGASLKTRARWAPMIRLAIYGGNIEIIKLLVKKGVDINEVSEGFSSTPLKYALAQPDKEIAEYLMSIGAKLEAD